MSPRPDPPTPAVSQEAFARRVLVGTVALTEISSRTSHVSLLLNHQRQKTKTTSGDRIPCSEFRSYRNEWHERFGRAIGFLGSEWTNELGSMWDDLGGPVVSVGSFGRTKEKGTKGSSRLVRVHTCYIVRDQECSFYRKITPPTDRTGSI